MEAVSIVLFSEVFPPQKGGSGRWFWELYRRLPMPVHVVAGAAPGTAVFDGASTLDIARVPMPFTNWGLTRPSSAWWYARLWLQFRRIVKQRQPQAVHCGKCLPEGFLAWLLKGTDPLVRRGPKIWQGVR